jgi:hypothetical protein
MHQVFVLHLLFLLLKLLHNFFHVHSIPNDDRVCDQIEAAHLIAKLFISLTSTNIEQIDLLLTPEETNNIEKAESETWLKVFPIPQLEQGLLQLIALMNVFGKRLYLPPRAEDFYFSSA